MLFETDFVITDEEVIIVNKMTIKSIFQLSLATTLFIFLLGKAMSFVDRGPVYSNPLEVIFWFFILFLTFSFVFLILYFLIKEQYVLDKFQNVIKYNINELFRLVDTEFFFSNFIKNNFLLFENSQSFLKIDIHSSHGKYQSFQDSFQSMIYFTESNLNFVIIDLIEKIPFATKISSFNQNRSLIVEIRYFNISSLIYFSIAFNGAITSAIIFLNLFLQESITANFAYLIEVLIVGNILIGLSYILIYYYDYKNQRSYKFTLNEGFLVHEDQKIQLKTIETETNSIIVGGRHMNSLLISAPSDDEDSEMNSDQKQFGFLFTSDNLEFLEQLESQIKQLLN